jgi:tRNA (guanine26-N2/guanine27-N2)-dimethyltransferase
VHINFYVRLFVRVYTSPNEVKKTPTKLATVFQCSGCDSIETATLARLTERNGNVKIIPGILPVGPRCEHCGRPNHTGGPIWAAPMHDDGFVSELLHSLRSGRGAELASCKRLVGMLTSCREELADVPLFHSLEHMCTEIALYIVSRRVLLTTAGTLLIGATCFTCRARRWSRWSQR